MILGQIPEAIYFALFMIFTKRLTTKRIAFTVLMIIEYMLLTQLIHYNIYFQMAYTASTYILLKLLYKEKAQITDIFTFTIGSVFLIGISALCGALYINNIWPYIPCLMLNRICIFITLFLLRKKLHIIQGFYKKLWNRNDKVKKKLKSVTFRSINVVILNLIFYIINIGMVYALYYNSK